MECAYGKFECINDFNSNCQFRTEGDQPSEVHANSYPHRGKRGGGWGGELDGTPPQSILYVAVFRNDFAFVESLSSSRQDRYILWVVALLEVCDITKKWSLSWILQRITN